jgi:hypothetical protein
MMTPEESARALLGAAQRVTTDESIRKIQDRLEDKLKELDAARGYSKADSGKPPLALLPPEALVEIASVLGHGAKKYGEHNWRKGGSWVRLMSAAMRHQSQWLSGEDYDLESSLHHLAHACCCLMFLLSFHFTPGAEGDDRYKSPITIPLRAGTGDERSGEPGGEAESSSLCQPPTEPDHEDAPEGVGGGEEGKEVGGLATISVRDLLDNAKPGVSSR